MREMARAQAAKEQAEKAEKRAEKAEKQVGNLTVSLEKEHKRFLLERRKRVGYMKGWAIRGKILTDSCGYSIERMDAESDILEEKYSEKLKEIVLKESDKIDQESGF
jgi:NCAIR mutase (PurE)-related protein